MEKLNLNDVVEYIENNISTFHQKRIASLNLHIVPINGCCYGKNSKPDKGDYFKYCGQEFWEFISNESNLYLEIIEPLGNKAKERNEEFQTIYGQMINRFTKEFISDFCIETGEINWQKLVAFNSSKVQKSKKTKI